MKKSYVKVRMLVNTAYQGPRKEGEVVSVPEDFANRWVKNGIAAYVSGQDSVVEETIEDAVEEVVEEPTVEEVVDDVVNYESMSAKELFALCKDKGIDVEAKKGKDYYIEKLNG